MSNPAWVDYSAQRQKRKRAALACEVCHSKKIRCDLQTRSTQGHNTCTNCALSAKECHVRQPKRDKIRQGTDGGRNHPLTPPGDSSATSSNVLDPIMVPGDSPELLDMDLSALTTNAGVTAPQREALPPLPPTNGGSMLQRPNPMPSQTASISMNDISPSTRSDRYPVDPGFLHIYGPENESDARNQVISSKKQQNFLDVSQPDLQQSFTETYFEYCYPWCPILDKSSLASDLAQSPLLDNALALVGSHVQPPMIPHAGPESYYDRARRRFYDDEEADLITSLKAVLLFYWWAPRSPTMVHRHSSWWWTSVVIRHCQQAGFSHESESDSTDPQRDLGIRRRIWWTAFARERLTSICQGKPCIIDPEDCNIPEPSLDDFPPDLQDKSKAEVFIYWVRLCAIIGRVAKYLSRSSSDSSSNSFPVHLGKELIEWVRSLPSHLQLPIGASYTANFNRDAHQLHLPYLTIIIVLYLKRSPQSSLPHALPPSILAATCLARIMKDILVRGGTRYLMAISCWYSGMAFIALLQASVNEELKPGADADLDILTLAIKQLKTMWGTANVFDQGFERLRANAKSSQSDDFLASLTSNDASGQNLNSVDTDMHNGVDWLDYFPFVSAQTSPVADKLLAQQSMQVFPFDSFFDTSLLNFQDVFEGFDSWNDKNLF
ncbi:hypothetical protein LTR10_019172 [Elasticomyces elasticus]|nr:hypothetical protein LTR10_019172 [Elasticomyces elasticus]KAK5025492.1 hypothetical protein LTR13_010456 [Exophiala sideris]KAK5029765.1 hypothetical protein LTS07_005489 [Exophiala sideris]KAK5178554.1 hypothetical protein LTR44_008925 [Eurotiomycetes sp. CCFEE 6388]